MNALSDQLVDAVSKKASAGGIDERDAPIEVQAAEPLACGVEKEIVVPSLGFHFGSALSHALFELSVERPERFLGVVEVRPIAVC